MKFGNTISLKDNFTSTMRDIIKKQKDFKDEAKKVNSMMDNMEVTRRMNVNNNRAVKSMREVDRHADKVKDGIEQVDRSRANPRVSVRDRATGKLQSIKEKMKDLMLNPIAITATVAGVGAGAGYLLKQGSNLEQQEVSMRHFISVNNEGLAGDELDKVRDNFITALRENANATPFKTAEVVSAGARAINVAQGDTNQAMELVKLAENMAALNPEKSLQDAIEALADLKVGEGERMKEFGFKITGGDMAQMVGAENFASMSEDQMLKAYNKVVDQKLNPYFAGGAEKLAGTGAGLFSTVLGKLGSEAQDAGRAMLDAIKQPLRDMIKLIDDNQQMFDSLQATAVNMFTAGVQGAYDLIDVLTRTKEYMQNQFGDEIKAVALGVSGMFDGIKAGADPAIEVIKKTAETVKTFLRPALDGFGNSLLLLNTFSEITFPFLAEAVSSAYDVAKPLIDTLGDSFMFWSDKIALINDKLKEWEWIHPFLQGMTGTLITYIGLLKAYEAIKTAVVAVQTAWNVALAANPIGLVILGISALIGAGMMLYKHWDKVKYYAETTFVAIYNTVGNIATKVSNVFSEMVLSIKKALANMVDKIPDIALPKNLENWRDQILSAKEEVAKKQVFKPIEVKSTIPKADDKMTFDPLNAKKMVDNKEFTPQGINTNIPTNEQGLIKNNNKSPLNFRDLKLADHITVREDADIDKITDQLAQKITEAQENGAGVGKSWSYGY